MQTSITKISMKINSEESSVKAYVSIVLNNSVKISIRTPIKRICRNVSLSLIMRMKQIG